MTIDRTPKPCLHLRANHQHGSHLAYAKDDCRCPPCTAAQSRYGKRERYRSLSQTHSYVPAEPARLHVKELLQTLTIGQIENRSGVNRTAIRVLLGDFPGRPASKRITRTSERALLAVRGDRVGTEDRGLVDGTGTRRRIRALIALGWPAKRLGRLMGMSSRTTWDLTRLELAESAPVRVQTRNAVHRLYDQLSLTVPPPAGSVTKARAIAASRGWLPPLAWDDDEIDDPKAGPATRARPDPTKRRNRNPDLEEAVVALTHAGLSVNEIAVRLGTYPRYVNRVRARYKEEGAA